VVLGRCVPDILGTYSGERQAVAQELIDFDRDMADLFAARAGHAGGSNEEVAPRARFQEYFTKHARFTAGVETHYDTSMISHAPTHQRLASRMTIGKRFQSEAVVRLADAKRVHLGHTIKADGRWRIFVFADANDPTDPSSRLAKLGAFLQDSPDSPVVGYTPPGADADSVFDVRAVCQQFHRDLAIGSMPPFLLPRKGRLGLIDYEKIFCADLRHGPDIFDSRGIDRAHGCMIVVRPDQYVAHVLPLDDHKGLAAFVGGFMTHSPPPA
jgi:hypothetical protein